VTGKSGNSVLSSVRSLIKCYFKYG